MITSEKWKYLKLQKRRILLERRIRNDELRLAACDIRINRILFDITQFHSCEDSLYWHGCYGSDTAFKKYITPDSFAHPAKMSFLLCDRIFKHLEKLGLLHKGMNVIDFMAGSGRTSIIASLRGYDSLAIELEPHFIKMINENIALTKKQINRNVNTEVIQGDARKMSELLKGRGFVGVVSPPYQDAIQSEHHGIDTTKLQDGIKNPRTKYLNNLHYSSNPSNIGNLKDKALVGVVSPPYQDTSLASERTEEDNLNKLIQLKNEGKKLSKRTLSYIKNPKQKPLGQLGKDSHYNSSNPSNIDNLKDKALAGITSPPYEESITRIRKSGANKLLKEFLKTRNRHRKEKLIKKAVRVVG